MENAELATARTPHKKRNGRDAETIGSSPTALVSDKQNVLPTSHPRVYRCKKAVMSSTVPHHLHRPLAPGPHSNGAKIPGGRLDSLGRIRMAVDSDPRLQGQIILDDPRFHRFPTFHSQILLLSFGPCRPLKIPHLPVAASCARDAPGHTNPGLETQQVVEISFGVQQLDSVGWFNLQNDSTSRGLILSSKQRIIEHHITTLLYRGILRL